MNNATKLIDADQLYLIERAQIGDYHAKERLVADNIGLVKSVAKRFYAVNKDPDDLFQVGCIGLLKAIERYDSSYGVCFSTYAVPLIMGEIRRCIRDDQPMSAMRVYKERAAMVEKKRRELIAQGEAEPHISDLAAALNWQPEQVVQAMNVNRPLVSINEEMFKDAGGKTIEDIISTDPDCVDKLLERISMEEIIDTLPEKLARIIYLRYYEDKTQTEISKSLGISQVQVSRLEKKALSQLQALLE